MNQVQNIGERMNKQDTNLIIEINYQESGITVSKKKGKRRIWNHRGVCLLATAVAVVLYSLTDIGRLDHGQCAGY